ncbi:MAG: BlaI/MecI/CopY family transcriptional regulator [Eubacteriales bacterium]
MKAFQLGEPLGEIEQKFANLVWENEPITSMDLVKLCEEALNWKKSTTFSILRKFCQRGIFKNEKSLVSSLISKEELKLLQSKQFLENTYDGSLPQFIAAFVSKSDLSSEELAEIQKIIQNQGQEGENGN